MRRVLSLSNALGRFVERVGMLAAWTALVLVVVIMFDVIGRHFFSTGSAKLQELEWHLHAILFMFCLGLGYVHDTHVRIDIIRERLSLRVQCWIEIVGCIFFLFPFCLVVIYYGFELTQRSWLASEISSSATGLPYRWLIKASIPAGMIVLLLAGISVLLRSIVRLHSPGLLHSPSTEVDPSGEQDIVTTNF